ncbi:GNAT family N-acetyltransferase [Crenobacter sp. SG2303]|uniref:GNAT family N-acetyltransferase n=1 Tax=Crenobacter oryzisoli TaxID=3056844 RepID=A0ABT7XTL3_9NEIS|nr:GNAT family N-acetyltransferase [Crenobacter sp. SG2303]MDN0077065.1 GNAT family N-acetyltransferase [Crenobacter sp. SG2303]
MNTTRLYAATDAQGQILDPVQLGKALPVHRQLRPRLPADEAGYLTTLARVCADGGRIELALQGDQVVGVALYRIYENTYEGRRLYIDDLVTDEAHRSQGVGSLLLARCEAIAYAAGCRFLTLDSGTHRTDAHRFYFREGMVINAFHFTRELD